MLSLAQSDTETWGSLQGDALRKVGGQKSMPGFKAERVTRPALIRRAAELPQLLQDPTGTAQYWFATTECHSAPHSLPPSPSGLCRYWAVPVGFHFLLMSPSVVITVLSPSAAPRLPGSNPCALG